MRRQTGLTLIEVLVALALWGLMTALMSQGLDLVLRSQQQQKLRESVQAQLQTGLAQWQIDLDQLDPDVTLPPPLEWDGRSLRMIRHSAGVAQGQRMLVVWALEDGHWTRWQSPNYVNRVELLQAIQVSRDNLTATAPPAGWQSNRMIAAQRWQLLFYRKDSWGNALSGSGTEGFAMPDAIRLQLDLNAPPEWSGPMQWDWVRPTWSVNRT